jgi:hypothetical protein
MARYINKHTGEVAELVGTDEWGHVDLALTTGPEKGWITSASAKQLRDHWTLVKD